jgi:hypothetical protein
MSTTCASLLPGLNLYGGAYDSCGQKAQHLLSLSCLTSNPFGVVQGLALGSHVVAMIQLRGSASLDFTKVAERLQRELGPHLVVRASPAYMLPGLLEAQHAVPNTNSGLVHALRALANSWDTVSATSFRRIHRYPTAFALGAIVQNDDPHTPEGSQNYPR